MITRIEGMADNHALVFAPGEDGYWSAEVPPDMEDGVYYVTLTAWDAAGNSTYYATILMMVEAERLTVTWLPDVYVQRWAEDAYTCAWLPDRHAARWQADSYAVAWLPNQYDCIWR